MQNSAQLVNSWGNGLLVMMRYMQLRIEVGGGEGKRDLGKVKEKAM